MCVYVCICMHVYMYMYKDQLVLPICSRVHSWNMGNYFQRKLTLFPTASINCNSPTRNRV